MANPISELTAELKENKIVFGGKIAMKLARKEALEKVYISNDCPENIEKKLAQTKIKIIKLNVTKEGLADLCNKPFNISVVSVVKNK
ncbi:MAG: ribosomal L7Ae/L30e/S12e/Gadd45 family protein [Candidatus Pacearchaeota archaeon]|nr:ribosomal L7Ae/L30e/S12e/Gadd45 family protein [Candidatus Pacearchaeota archaeon]